MSPLKKGLALLHSLAFSTLVIFVMVITWNETFGHMLHVRHERAELEKTFSQIIEEQGEPAEEEHTTFEEFMEEGETVRHYLGYRVLEQPFIEGHFHHIDKPVGPDNRSHCIQCHGDIPHDKSKELRALWNMHAYVIACEVCHLRPDNPSTAIFQWYDRATGAVYDNPEVGVNPLPYTAKIMRFELKNGIATQVDTVQKKEFAKEFLETERDLSENQKAKVLKMIHQGHSEDPFMCDECHSQEDPALPLETLGYSKAQMQSIVSTEVVGMVNNYREFFMPSMLNPTEDEETQDEEKEEPTE